MGPSLLAPAGGWCAVHDGALQAPTVTLYMIGPFGPPLCMAPATGAGAGVPKNKKKLIAD